MHAVVLLLGAVALGTEPSARPHHESNSIFRALIDEGLKLPSGALRKFPQPLLSDGLDAAGQRAALESIADAAHPLDGLLRNSVVAPFVLKITSDKTDETATVRAIDLYFVAYGELERLKDEKYLEALFAPGGDAEQTELPTKTGVLKPEQLASRGFEFPPKEDRVRHYFAHSTFGMFDRVLVSTTRHAVGTSTPESIVLASWLDLRFQSDPEFPIEWKPLKRSPGGKFEIGPPTPYSGSAFYLKVTRLAEPAGALFIEHHHVYNEPYGWFDGANLLRSKLSLIVQNQVRDLRKRLAEK